jgi:hypothetical protein
MGDALALKIGIGFQ